MSSNLAASALQWWSDAGIDTILAEEPRDWLSADSKPPAPTVAEPGLAALPAPLDAFRHWLLTSDSFPPGRRIGPAGDPSSGLMILIDMPGQGDVEALLSGEIGAMFDRMLDRIGRSRATTYLASMLPVRNPTGRLPEKDGRLAEIARHHVGLVSPTALLLFGDECSKTLLGMPMVSARRREHALETPSGSVKTFVTMSLQFLFNQPGQRKEALADLQMLKEGLER